MSAGPTPAGAAWSAWIGTTLGCAFWAWCALADTASMRDPALALAGYARALGPGLVAGSVAFLALRFLGGAERIEALAVAALGAYAASLVVVLGAVALALALAFAGWLFWRSRGAGVPPRPTLLLLLHAQGTLGGLYLAVRIEDQLDGWPVFTQSLRAVWTIIV